MIASETIPRLPERLAAGMAFVTKCQEMAATAGLIAQFQTLIRDFGFDVTAGGCWTGVGKERRYRFFFNNWPADWQAYYAEQNFFDRDFIVEASRRSITPFLWNEMDEAVFKSPGAREFVVAARERHGWVDGFVVPIRGPGGFEGVVSLAATHYVTLEPGERATLEMMSRALHERCRLEVGLGAEAPAEPPLTERELECMKWAAGGKSDWQIGALLGITGATVHFHVEQAKKKLGVRSRVQAVAILVLHGMI